MQDEPEKTPKKPLRARSKLGKYRLVKKVAEGGFARVYRARDSIEGIEVALKIPHDHWITKQSMAWFRKEAKVNASLDHPNILPVKNAEFIDGHFVIAYPLGKRSLAQRLRNRIATDALFGFMEQILEGVAHAHERGIVHCDLKPENFILFDENRLRLADFGVARLARRTVRGSGSGTIGYVAPEQALGITSTRGDVFSLGLMFWSMLTGELPEYPFDWPPPGYDRVRGKVHPDLLALIRRAIEVEPKRRFADARQMCAAFLKLKPRLRRHLLDRRRGRGRNSNTQTSATRRDWKQVRFRNFERLYRKQLWLDRFCGHCEGPVSECMANCPWCKQQLAFEADDTTFPDTCGRCDRGRKLDWRFCAWCYGRGFEEVADRRYPDKRYASECKACDHPVMPFMRYCPGCRRKLDVKWQIKGTRERCDRCGWGVVREYWDHCAWCGDSLNRESSR